MLTGYYVATFLSIYYIATQIQSCNAAEKAVSHSCDGDPSNTNLINVTIRIIPHQDPIFKVYGFDASSGDTSLSANRVDACVRDTSGITDVDTDAIEFNLSFDTSGSSFECGATVTDIAGATGVKKVRVILRVFAYSENMLSGDDDVFIFDCRSDNLNSEFLSSGALDQSTVAVPTVFVLPSRYGKYLTIRDAVTDVPITVGYLNQPVYLSVEFYPEISQGPDVYGTTHYVGFLGNDVISGTSASSLFIVVIPRYTGRTDVSVTTPTGTLQQNVSDGSPMTFTIPPEVQGCSDGGVAEIEYKGVKVHSYDKEVAVLVYNREADTEDVYTARPADILGDRYYTVSMPSNNAADVSEFMIVGTVNGTSITVTIPSTTSLSVTLNGTTKSAGEVLTFTLNEMQAFHLAVSSSTTTESLTGYLVTGDNPFAVFSGNRRFSNDHLVDQLPATTQLGDHYILPPADPEGDSRLTTYIVQAVESGDTIVTRYLTSSTNENYTITSTTNPVKTITVAHNEPCEIFSDKPVMVTQIINPPTGSNTDFEPSMLVMPPIYQYSHEYKFYHADYQSKLTFVLPSDDAGVAVNGAPLSIGNKLDVIGPSGFKFADQGLTLPGGTAFTLGLTSSSNKLHQFLPIAYATKSSNPKNSGSVHIPPGVNGATKGYCYPAGVRGDHVDNDCDGRIDEELVDNLDNDGDGFSDEDTVASSSELAGALAIRPFNCIVSGVADFSDPTKQVVLTQADGCKVNGTGPFTLTSDFVNVVSGDIGTGSNVKNLVAKNTTLAKFVDSAKLYFKCDTTLCYSATDDNCRVICASSSSRRKREDDDVTPDNITSEIWINPYLPDNTPVTTTDDVTQDVSTQLCLEDSNIQLMLSVLMVLFVIAFSTAICFCCLFRRRWNEDKQHKRRAAFTTFRDSSSVTFRRRDYPTRYRY